MSDPALHATALAAALTAAPARPSMKTRRWPHRSPSLPTAGPMMPKARIGPLTTQVSVLCEAPRSSEMRGMETARIVTVTFTENSPTRRTVRIVRGDRSARRAGSSSPSTPVSIVRHGT
jgi:hypothetical protein